MSGYNESIGYFFNTLSSDVRQKKSDKDIRALCQAWKRTKDKHAQWQVVASYIPLCIKISNQVARDYHMHEDARNELGWELISNLTETVERFDPEYHNLFYSYALKRLKGGALTFVRNHYNLNSNAHKNLFFSLRSMQREHQKNFPNATEEEQNDWIKEAAHKKWKIRVTDDDIKTINDKIKVLGQDTHSDEFDFAFTAYDDENSSTELRPSSILEHDENNEFHRFFYLEAQKNLSPLGWHIIEQVIIHDTPKDLKRLALKLGMSLQKVQKTLDDSLKQLQQLYDQCNGIQKSEWETNFTIKDTLQYYDTRTNILLAAYEHIQTNGDFPNTCSAIITSGPLEGEKWSTINSNLHRGKYPDISEKSLAELFAPYADKTDLKPEEFLKDADIFDASRLWIPDILQAAQEFHRESEKGAWPSCHDYTPIKSGPLEGETWGALDKLLRDGGRGLKGGSSLFQLLKEHGLGSTITIDVIIDEAKKWHNRTGAWPSSSDTSTIPSGKLRGKNWKSIDGGLTKGYWGLDGGTSLSKLLRAHGCHNDLSADTIIQEAKKWHNRTGAWPSSKDTREITSGELIGEKWSTIHRCLRDGHRGLTANGKGLHQFLKDNDCVDRKPVSLDVMYSCLTYKAHSEDNSWPNNKTKLPVKDKSILMGMTWAAVDKRKIEGLSLKQTITLYETNPEYYNELIQEHIIKCAEADKDIDINEDTELNPDHEDNFDLDLDDADTIISLDELTEHEYEEGIYEPRFF